MPIIQAQRGYYFAPVMSHCSLDWSLHWGGDRGSLLSYVFTYFDNEDDVSGEDKYPHLYPVAEAHINKFVDTAAERAVGLCYSSVNRNLVVAWSISEEGLVLPVLLHKPWAGVLGAILYDDPNNEDAYPEVQSLCWSGTTKVSPETFPASDRSIKDSLEEAIWSVTRNLIAYQRTHPNNIAELAAEAEENAAKEAEREIVS